MLAGSLFRLARTSELKLDFNPFVDQFKNEFSKNSLDQEEAPLHKEKWREFLKLTKSHPLDLEIGTGAGHHFAHHSQTQPNRFILGLEAKYKPLVQSIRRALDAGAQNAFMVRYNAYHIEELFSEEEIDNVYIHHPDPWPKKKHFKHRLIQDGYLDRLWIIQKSDTFIEFKTDSRDYFDWSLERFNNSKYKKIEHTFDLHNSEYIGDNFVTQFEQIFLNKNQPIYWAKLYK